MTPASDITIVVVAYRSSALLRANLAPLTRSRPELLAVVVENFSSADEADRTRRLAAEEGWTFVPLEVNVGFGAGMNAGVDAARRTGRPIIVLLNPDAVIDGDTVVELATRISASPLTLASPRIERGDGTRWFAGAALDMRRGRILGRLPVAPGDPAWLSGACLVTSTELWARIGGFDEDYFLYWEDVDLSFRAVEVGGTLEVFDDLVAVHDEGGTQDRGDDLADFSTDYYYFNVRNRLLFAWKHLDERTRRRWLLHTAHESYRILRRGAESASSSIPGNRSRSR